MSVDLLRILTELASLRGFVISTGALQAQLSHFSGRPLVTFYGSKGCKTF
jgi:hypothetical protein